MYVVQPVLDGAVADVKSLFVFELVLPSSVIVALSVLTFNCDAELFPDHPATLNVRVPLALVNDEAEIVLSVKYLELPLIYYKGYSANTNKNNLEVSKSENVLVNINVDELNE